MAKRAFLFRSDDDRLDDLMDAIAGREHELASYDANIESYTEQIAAMNGVLPNEWPEELVKFKGRSNEQVFLIGLTGEQADVVSQLNHRERLKMLLFTEKAECRKSELAYGRCLSSLPTDEAVLQAAKDRYTARRAAMASGGE